MLQQTADPTDHENAERQRLVRYCMRWTGDAAAAEDIAQLTLIEAWRSRDTLRDPEARQSWLFGIARHQCLTWSRRTRSRRGEVPLSEFHGIGADNAFGFFPDFEVDLERDDLARLLDRALQLLPSQARSILIERYLEETPQRELANRLRLSESAVEARLYRGKLALRHVLMTELYEEAVELGLVSGDRLQWQSTRIWCPLCGRRRLLGHLADGALALRCPDCTPAGKSLTNGGPPELLEGVRGFKPALTRLLMHAGQWARETGVNRAAACPRCATMVPLLPTYRVRDGFTCMAIACPKCKARVEQNLAATVLTMTEVRQFWRDHPRMRILPDRAVGTDGPPTLLVQLESVTNNARLEVVVDGNTFERQEVERIG